MLDEEKTKCRKRTKPFATASLVPHCDQIELFRAMPQTIYYSGSNYGRSLGLHLGFAIRKWRDENVACFSTTEGRILRWAAGLGSRSGLTKIIFSLMVVDGPIRISCRVPFKRMVFMRSCFMSLRYLGCFMSLRYLGCCGNKEPCTQEGGGRDGWVCGGFKLGPFIHIYPVKFRNFQRIFITFWKHALIFKEEG